ERNMFSPISRIPPGNEIAVPASKLDKATDCGSELNPMEAPPELPSHRPLSSDSDFISRNNAEGPQQFQVASLDDGIKAVDEMNRRTVTAPSTILGEVAGDSIPSGSISHSGLVSRSEGDPSPMEVEPASETSLASIDTVGRGSQDRVRQSAQPGSPPIPDGEYLATYGEATIWVGIKTKVEKGARMVKLEVAENPGER
ncbi:hypothetical protein FOZ63_008904, partial [Perkinsus olseni]